MSVSLSKSWSFPASANHKPAPAACLLPRGSADAPEQPLKWDLRCCHQPLCTDNTLCGCDDGGPGPVPEHLFRTLSCWMISGCHTTSIEMHLCSCLCTCLHMQPSLYFALPDGFTLSLTLLLSVSVNHFTPHLRILVMSSFWLACLKWPLRLKSC